MTWQSESNAWDLIATLVSNLEGSSAQQLTMQEVYEAIQRAYAAAGQNALLLRQLTDEQEAHRLTSRALTTVIRENDRAEEYRVQRDKLAKRLALYEEIN